MKAFSLNHGRTENTLGSGRSPSGQVGIMTARRSAATLKTLARFTRSLPSSLPKIALAFILFHVIAVQAQAAEFSYENLEGQVVSIESQPLFIITTKSESDLKDALRCASYLESLANKPKWVIDLAWPQSEFAKRLAAKRLIKSEFMRERCAILDESISPRNLVALLNAKGETIWNSASYPSDNDWDVALAKRQQSPSQ